jgi:flagellar export protein FliJ
MPFRFPLEAVLLVRENAEKREEHALQSIQLEIARMLRMVEELSANIARAHADREQALQRPIPALQLHSFLWETVTAAEKKKVLLSRLQSMELERDRQMQKYQAAHRDHETVIDMFTEQQDAYEQEQARNQQKNLDDIFIARRHRS